MTYQTKLGIKMILSGGDGARICLHARPTVAAFVDGGWELAHEFAADKPLCIGRVTENFFDPNRPEFNQQSPEAVARWYVETYLAETIRAQPQMDAWESNNEPVITDLGVMNWHARFLAEFARILRVEFNRTAVIGNWSVGNPDYPMWAQYGPALEATLRYRALLGRHNYAGRDPNTWPFLLLRHRADNQRFSAMGYPNLPVVLTECGADGVPSFRVQNPATGEWYDSEPGASWRDLYGDDGARYWNEILLPLEQELRSDPYVIGGTVFNSGYNWGRHNIDGTAIAQLWIDYAMSAPPIGDAETPPPAPEFPYLARVGGLLGRNLRNAPGGDVVGLAYRGGLITIVGQDGPWLETRLRIHESGVTRL